MNNGEARGLKVLILFEAAKNEYNVSAHNLTPDEAERLIQEWNRHLVEGCRLITVAQQRRHQTIDPENCRACREAVARTSGLDPMPAFKRRKP